MPIPALKIRGCIFSSIIGISNEERKYPRNLVADIDLIFVFLGKDTIDSTVDYEKVIFIVRDVGISKEFFLLETLGNEIISSIYSAYPSLLKSICLRLHKEKPLVSQVKNVYLELTKNYS